MQSQSNIRPRGNDGAPEHISGKAASWGALVAYLVTVCHTIHCGVWLYVIGPVASIALIAATGAITIAAKHWRASVRTTSANAEQSNSSRASAVWLPNTEG